MLEGPEAVTLEEAQTQLLELLRPVTVGAVAVNTDFVSIVVVSSYRFLPA